MEEKWLPGLEPALAPLDVPVHLADADQLEAITGYRVHRGALADDAISLRELAAAPPERLALVFGAEGDGLSTHALEAADRVVTIPMRHGVDSLNVAAAAAVVLYALAVDMERGE